MANPTTSAAYVAMLESKLKLAETKLAEVQLQGQGQFKMVKAQGTSKKNGKDYSGWKFSGPAWGYVSDGLLRAIVAHMDEVRKSLG